MKIGEFWFDISRSELSDDTRTSKLEPLAFAFLMELVDHAGQVVSREQVLEKVWDNRVVSDDSIRKVVKKLRDAFDDDARNPRYIKTLPLKGYSLLVKPQKPGTHQRVVHPKWLAVLGIMLVLIVSVFWQTQFDHQAPGFANNPAGPEITLLTNLPGSEVEGDFHPGLNRLIFLYRNSSEKPWHIFTKDLSNNRVERLTWGDSSHERPKFSPQGDKVAFVKSQNNRETSYVADFDSERGLINLKKLELEGLESHVLSWSHDGESIYLSGEKKGDDAMAVFKKNLKTDESSQVTFPNVEGFGDYYAKESPRGKYLALFRNVSDRSYAMIILELSSMQLVRHLPLSFFPSALIWQQDEDNLAISSFKGDFYYYSINSEELVEQTGSRPGINDVFYTCGNTCFYMRRHKMHYSEIVEVPNPFADGPARPMIHKESDNAEFNPVYNPDGDTLYYTSKSDKTGYLYKHRQGQTAEILHTFNPRHILTDISVNEQETQLVGKLENRVFILDLTVPAQSESAFRFITTALEIVSHPAWNREGNAVYFSRKEQYKSVLLKYDLTTDELIKQEQGITQRRDLTDGRVVVVNEQKELFIQNNKGERQFIVTLPYHLSNYWQVHNEFLYFSSIDNNHFYLNRVDLTRGHHDKKLISEYAWEGDFKLHPGGLHLVTTNSIPANSDLIRVEWAEHD